MKNLFIIGNGFDIAHNLPTRYSDFQSYLIKKYPEASSEYLEIPQSTIMPDGEEKYNDNDIVGFLLKIISKSEAAGKAWGDLENTIGHLDFDECFDNVYDDDNVYQNMDIAVKIRDIVPSIKNYFSDWINTIEISHAKPKIKFSNLIDPNRDLFLTFNYTETLEYLYNVKNICHIHGKQGETLIFGHGNNTDYYDSHMNNHIGAEDYLYELHETLRKDTQSIINQTKKLFIKMGKVDEIYSFGFSFSDVDMVYIKELCSVSNTENKVWYLNDFNKEKFETFRDKLVKCGFNGAFDTFNI